MKNFGMEERKQYMCERSSPRLIISALICLFEQGNRCAKEQGEIHRLKVFFLS